MSAVLSFAEHCSEVSLSSHVDDRPSRKFPAEFGAHEVFRVLYLVRSVFDVGNLSGTFRKPLGNLSDFLSAPPVSSQIVSRPRVVSTVLSAVLSAHRGGFVSTVLSAPWFLFFRVLSGVPLFSGFVSTILLYTPFQIITHHSVTHPETLRLYAQACGLLLCEQFGRLPTFFGRLPNPYGPSRITLSLTPTCRMSCRPSSRAWCQLSRRPIVGCPCPCNNPLRCVISCRLISDVLSAPPVSKHVVSPRVVSTVSSAVLSAHRWGFVSTVLSAPWFLFFRVSCRVSLPV